MRQGISVIGVAAALLVVVVLGVGLLYAYRSQAPALQQVPYAQALSEIQNGQVRSAVVEDHLVTLRLNDGSQQQTVAPDNGDALARAVTSHNASDPTHPVEFSFMNGGGAGIVPLFTGVIVALSPILVLGALALYAASAYSRSRAPQRYEALARIADLRDRGVLSEEEFQREKRRLLK